MHFNIHMKKNSPSLLPAIIVTITKPEVEKFQYVKRYDLAINVDQLFVNMLMYNFTMYNFTFESWRLSTFIFFFRKSLLD